MSIAHGNQASRDYAATMRLMHGIEATVDLRDRILWLDSPATGMSLALGLDSLRDAEFNRTASTLTLALHSGLRYIEVPCTGAQVKALFSLAGWELDRLEYRST